MSSAVEVGDRLVLRGEVSARPPRASTTGCVVGEARRIVGRLELELGAAAGEGLGERDQPRVGAPLAEHALPPQVAERRRGPTPSKLRKSQLRRVAAPCELADERSAPSTPASSQPVNRQTTRVAAERCRWRARHRACATAATPEALSLAPGTSTPRSSRSSEQAEARAATDAGGGASDRAARARASGAAAPRPDDAGGRPPAYRSRRVRNGGSDGRNIRPLRELSRWQTRQTVRRAVLRGSIVGDQVAGSGAVASARRESGRATRPSSADVRAARRGGESEHAASGRPAPRQERRGEGGGEDAAP